MKENSSDNQAKESYTVQQQNPVYTEQTEDIITAGSVAWPLRMSLILM